MSSFHSTISKLIVPDGAGTGRRALVRLTRLHEEISRAATGPTQPAATPEPDPRAPPVASECRRDGGQGRVPQEAREIFVCPFSKFDRGVKAECCIVPAPSKRQIRSDGNADRSRRNSLRKFAPIQSHGLKRNVVSRALGSLVACDRARAGCVRSVSSRCGLRGMRVGSARPARSCNQGV